MEDKLYSIQKQFAKEGIVFSYCGIITQGLTEGLGDIIKAQTELMEVSVSAQMTLFSTFVEMLQNTLHYSQEKSQNSIIQENGEQKKGIIVIESREGRFYLNSGNFIKNQDVEKLRDKLSKLQRMDKNELKAFYKEKRKQPREEGSKGAGLGFIEMARHATSLKFNIEPINDIYSFFSLEVCF